VEELAEWLLRPGRFENAAYARVNNLRAVTAGFNPYSCGALMGNNRPAVLYTGSAPSTHTMS
jgi:hypothetical protein